jgi:hypothetical protein
MVAHKNCSTKIIFWGVYSLNPRVKNADRIPQQNVENEINKAHGQDDLCRKISFNTSKLHETKFQQGQICKKLSK